MRIAIVNDRRLAVEASGVLSRQFPEQRGRLDRGGRSPGCRQCRRCARHHPHGHDHAGDGRREATLPHHGAATPPHSWL